MVRLLTTLLLLHLPLTAFSSPDLKLLIEQNKQQLGYAFNATLIANDISENLSGIDLSSLRKDFGVIVNEYSGDQGNIKTRTQQQLSLELYPRRTGHIQVPELLFASSSSSHIDVEVLPAITASGPINIKYNVSTFQPWQRQQVLLTVNVTTLSNVTHLNTGWAIFSLSSGNHEFSPPPVLYHLQGVVERRFYLPTIQLDVKPLPSYIPPLMPVGRVFIESRLDDNSLLNTDTIYNWIIRLHSPELLAHHLPPILRQVTSDDNITFQPAQSVRR